MHSQYSFPNEFLKNFRIPYLLAHFILEDLTIEEEDELEKWIQESDRNMQIFEDFTDDRMIQVFMDWYFRQDHDKYLEQTKKKLVFRKKIPVITYLQYAAAACFIALFAWGVYAVFNTQRRGDNPVVNDSKNDIAPGSAAALLRLADGRTIRLDGIADSTLSASVEVEGGVVINNPVEGETGYHELVVPRKGFFRLKLPDGTNAWINAASSIRYPVSFTGAERRVNITGEAYFEVAKDPEHPFIVSAGEMEVTALGTEFNVNAYANEESVKTTLVEGSVGVSAGGRQTVLSPGQQLSAFDGSIRVSTVDVTAFTAWTRNQFKLKNNTIGEVMRMVERWYDAEIVYRDEIKDHFTGTIDRSVPVSRLLKLLEATGQVHFTIDGQKIMVGK